MKTVQMTLDEKLVKEVDKAVKKLGISRSKFTRIALKKSLDILHEKEQEKQHIQGYKKKPVKKGDFDIFEKEQVWID